MKKILVLAAVAMAFTVGAYAQNGRGRSSAKGNENKEWKDKGENRRNDNKDDDRDHDRERNRDRHERDDDDDQGRGRKGSKYSKNVPTQVMNAFTRDYPNATNVTWKKDRGSWTATFGGILGTRTATYRANGERVDTNNTPVRKTKRSRTNTDGTNTTNNPRKVSDILKGQ